MIDLLSAFNTKATISRGVQTTAASGTPITTWKVTAQNVPCRVTPMNGRQFELYGRYVTRGGSLGFFDPALTLTARDRVTVSGRVYEVQFVEPRLDDIGETLSVFAVLEETK